MADIELVIKIPEEIYKNIQGEKFWLDSGLTLSNAYDFIKNGTVLPKGHGRLIDADDIKSYFSDREGGDFTAFHFYDTVENAPTIIEADKAEREEV